MDETRETISFYQLIDPRDNLPFYVGQTTDLARRLKDYLDRSYQSGRAVARRLRELEALGLIPIIQELERNRCVKSEADAREIHWIATLRSQGINLLNKQNNQQGRQRLTVYLELDVDRWIRHRIADTREEISDVINQAMRQFMAK